MIFRDAMGAEVLVAGDFGPVDGYTVTEFDDAERSFRKITVTAPRVDGAFDVAVALDRVNLRADVLVEGATKAEMRSKVEALLACVEQKVWLLDEGDRQWICTFSDSSQRRVGTEYGGDFARVVSLVIPAMPDPLSTAEES